jgi:ABC-type phosphate/phosphonate transport system ATPase subunit
MREILIEKQKIVDTVVDGRLVSIARDKSFFKEFVQKLNQEYYKSLNSVDLESVVDIETT